MKGKQAKIQSLQALRAIAAIAIAAAHTNRSTELHMNHTLGFAPSRFADWGVDLFFVISGFIIFYAHRNDFGKPYKLKEYLTKRILRIYPIYWIAALMVSPIFFIFQNIGSGFERDWVVIIKSFFLIPQTHSPILFVGWTLVHEFRFYLLFGLLLLLKRRRAILFTSIFILVNLMMFILKPIGYSNLNPQNLTGYLFSFFNIEFLLGALGAYIMSLSNTRLQKVFLFISIVCYLIILRFANSDILEQRVFLLGVPFAIIATLLGIYELKQSFKIPNIFCYLGAASYSIYLTHVLFITTSILLLKTAGFSNSSYLTLIMLVVLFLAVTGGYIFYSLVEKPLLKFLKIKFLTKQAPQNIVQKDASAI